MSLLMGWIVFLVGWVIGGSCIALCVGLGYRMQRQSEPKVIELKPGDYFTYDRETEDIQFILRREDQ